MPRRDIAFRIPYSAFGFREHVFSQETKEPCKCSPAEPDLVDYSDLGALIFAENGFLARRWRITVGGLGRGQIRLGGATPYHRRGQDEEEGE